MNPIIIASKKDPAGMNIIQNLKNLNSTIPIHLVETEIINVENIDKNLEADFIIFASKHQSKAGTKSLSVHPIGNWTKAEFGGKDKTICPSSALTLKHFFQTLNKNNTSEKYKTTLEATHHGPYIETPSLFIEIGSSPNEWKDKEVGKLIAKTIIEATETKPKKADIAFGIGGPHYCPNFNPIQLNNKFALSHIIAQYALPITKETIEEAISKTTEKIKYAIIDWKGLGKAEQRTQTIEVLNKFNIKVIKTQDAKDNP
jgi:D-aminoacyl-tRNA deacylase